MTLEHNSYIDSLNMIVNQQETDQILLADIIQIFELLATQPDKIIHFVNTDDVKIMYQQVFFQFMHVLKNDISFQQLLVQLLRYDRALFIHSLHVTIYTLLIGHKAQLDDAQLIELAKAALLHDIGKVAVSPTVLYKPAKLTTDEFNQVKEHVLYGYHYLKSHAISLSSTILKAVKQHHERLDGSGYPNGATYIHPFAKIIAVADVFDALTAERCYKQSLPVHEAYRILQLEAQHKVEPKYVNILMHCISVKSTKLISIDFP